MSVWQEHDFPLVYGLSACACNIFTAVCQYAVGELTTAAAASLWPYTSSLLCLTSIIGVGCGLTVALVAWPPQPSLRVVGLAAASAVAGSAPHRRQHRSQSVKGTATHAARLSGTAAVQQRYRSRSVVAMV